MSASSAAIAVPKPFREMGDATFTAELRRIIGASRSTDEVQQRLVDELGYPYSIAITSQEPVSSSDMVASALVHLLGGVHLASGEMVMVMALGPSGATINL